MEQALRWISRIVSVLGGQVRRGRRQRQVKTVEIPVLVAISETRYATIFLMVFIQKTVQLVQRIARDFVRAMAFVIMVLAFLLRAGKRIVQIHRWIVTFGLVLQAYAG
jgi:hypothetical protein